MAAGMMDDESGVLDSVARAVGVEGPAVSLGGVGGGCINRCLVVRLADGRCCFVKLNGAEKFAMFEAEAAGLTLLRQCHGLRVPQPLSTGREGRHAFIAMEYVALGSGGSRGQARLGRGLADLHRITAAEHGWERDNTIGSTPQINTPDSDWVRFFAERRLRFQFDLAAEHGYGKELDPSAERLLSRLADFFTGYEPVPSLVHGDLWSGNAAFDARGDPLVFDPACYFGDRETDLAMTELFGGFGADFYAAYRECYPLDEGYTRRRDLYQLYHLLNHLNLFGGAYLGGVRSRLGRLLRL